MTPEKRAESLDFIAQLSIELSVAPCLMLRLLKLTSTVFSGANSKPRFRRLFLIVFTALSITFLHFLKGEHFE